MLPYQSAPGFGFWTLREEKGMAISAVQAPASRFTLHCQGTLKEVEGASIEPSSVGRKPGKGWPARSGGPEEDLQVVVLPDPAVVLGLMAAWTLSISGSSIRAAM